MKPALVLSVLGLLALSGLALSAAAPACSRSGTEGRDILAGTPGRDVLCLLAGDDYAHGNGGNDVLRGGSGRDVLVAGKGDADRLLGEKGPDRLFVVDDRPGDEARGGGGSDDCFIDPGDRARGCERVFRGHSISTRQYLALQNAFFGGLELAEELIAEAAPPTPVPPAGPPGSTFPPCTPPPKEPPPPPC